MSAFGGGGGGFGSGLPTAPFSFGSSSAPSAPGVFGAAPAGSGPAAGGFFGSSSNTKTTSSFGGGFGAAAPGTIGTGIAFGAPSSTNSSGTFGVSSGGFGSPPPSTTATTSTGFGSSGGGFGGGSSNIFAAPSSGFGTPVVSAPSSGFGASNSSGPFGFGSSSQTQQPNAFATTTTTPFGGGAFDQQQSSGGLAFGNSANTSGTVSGGFGTGFGGGPGTGFGTSSNNAGFGTGSNTAIFGGGNNVIPTPAASSAGSFGTSTFGAPAASMSSPFGGFAGNTSSTASPFGQPQQNQNPFGQPSSTTTTFGNPVSNPFASTVSQPTSTMSFSASSNIVSGGFGTNTAGGFGTSFATTTTTTTNSSTYFGQNQSDLDMRTSPLPGSSGMSPQSMSPMRFGQQSDSEDMADPDESYHHQHHSSKQPASNLPFGTPVTVSSASTTPWSTTTSSFDYNKRTVNALSPIPEASSDQAESADDRLAKLKAKLEQKKKKLEEKQRRKEEDEQSNSKSASASPVPLPGNNDNNEGRRSLVRSFPTETRNKSSFPSSSYTVPVDVLQQQQHQREELQNAVSLVGTCLSMCPDEEIERREVENDIQLLEKVMPGTLHPRSWTLRDTMVKRFRRSAADYKLDVPEWVRPPDVLETVCGYLEEWVMERDRQGPDQRFIESAFNFKDSDGAPPSLDVYQFIWDRTRMVRKDFILQNYVGTGGNCDARAVRCHERIARWHAMCEHQLSHITDFVTKQSQQNIQELGQTMKTLNQFYDDSLNRSIIEVPDEQGKETRTDVSKFNHGCRSNIVQGQNPRDFDGTPLMNNEDASMVNRRLIGSNVHSSNHGTAEPEMRGLYILLTLENDGGMEVLKYAARLYQLRPLIYHTIPVQLALSIYKARKECNYARFFAILRAPSTPYLFACIMFKYVENMRKFAFCIMARTYGGKTKDSNEAMYDSYALQDLTHLLCFEDDDETRAACRHYNITVRNDEDGVESIMWRQTSFRDPKDPDKGTRIRLLPRKMVRTIESKIRGVTRLAVCRGEVCGEGAFLTNPQLGQVGSVADTPEERSKQLQAREEARRVVLEQQELLRKKKAEEAVIQRREEERKRKELEQQQRADYERRRQEEEKKRLELEARRKQEQEELEKLERQRIAQALEEEKRYQEIEAARKKAEQEEKERQERIRREAALRKEAEEKAREERLREEQRRLEAELEQKRKYQEMLERQEAERQRQRKELEEKRRREEERIRLEALQREEDERKHKAAEALRLRNEAEARIQRAKKKVMLLRWLQKLPRHLSIEERMHESLDRISPIAQMRSSTRNFILSSIKPPSKPKDATSLNPFTDIRRVAEMLLRIECKMSSLLAESILSECEGNLRLSCTPQPKITMLFKVAFILPVIPSNQDQSLCDLIRTWINSRLAFKEVTVLQRGYLDIRVVVIDGHDKEAGPHCDAAVFVIPPFWSEGNIDQQKAKEIESMGSAVDADIPRIVFAMCEAFHENAKKRQRSLVPLLSGSFNETLYIENSELEAHAIDDCLLSVCQLVARSLHYDETQLIERISLGRFALSLISEAIWQDLVPNSRDGIIPTINELLRLFMNELEAYVHSIQRGGISWPPTEFDTTRSNRINDYFGSGQHLPRDWISSLSKKNVGPSLLQLKNMLTGPLSEVVWRLIGDAPLSIQKECESFLDERNFRRFLQRALQWKIQTDEEEGWDCIVYVPSGLVRDVVQQTISIHKETVKAPVTKPCRSSGNTFMAETNSFIEDIDVPPTETPLKNSEFAKQKKRPRTEPARKEENQQTSFSSADFGRDVRVAKSRRPLTKEETDSINFTKRLKQLVAGEITRNMMIGETKLSSALRGAPALNFRNS